MNMSNHLTGKNVLLTGGGSGMGKAAALTLAQNGANVAIAGRNKENLTSTVSLARTTEKILAKEADVTDRKSLENLFQWFDVEFGTLDYLVHAAGINVAMRSMEELSPDDWDRLIQINLTGSYNVLRLTLNRMRPQKEVWLS